MKPLTHLLPTLLSYQNVTNLGYTGTHGLLSYRSLTASSLPFLPKGAKNSYLLLPLQESNLSFGNSFKRRCNLIDLKGIQNCTHSNKHTKKSQCNISYSFQKPMHVWRAYLFYILLISRMNLRMFFIISYFQNIFFLFWPCLDGRYIFKTSYFQFPLLEDSFGLPKATSLTWYWRT